MKKISFSFTKSKPLPIKPKNETKKDIQFIDCIESNAIKIKEGLLPEKEEELVIPVKSDNLPKKEVIKVHSSDVEDSIKCNIATASISNSTETLETVAVREILADSQKVKEKNSLTSTMVLPVAAEGKVTTAEESSLADYDNIPVSDFGMAMLRGMGWKPDKGIGKNEKVVEPSYPVLRPKGMGLGAEKRTITDVSSDENEDLTLKKGAFVLVVAGSNKNTYGEVQSFDEDAGRVIIKTALGGSNISANESAIQVVSKAEYKKCSRVLNQSKYDEYKKREDKDGQRRNESRSDSSESKRYRREDFRQANGKNFSGEKKIMDHF